MNIVLLLNAISVRSRFHDWFWVIGAILYYTMTSSNGSIPASLAFVRGIHRSPVNSLHKGPRRGAFMFSLTCAWINGWVNTREAGDLRRYRTHYDVTVMNQPLPLQVKMEPIPLTEKSGAFDNVMKNFRSPGLLWAEPPATGLWCEAFVFSLLLDIKLPNKQLVIWDVLIPMWDH